MARADCRKPEHDIWLLLIQRRDENCHAVLPIAIKVVGFKCLIQPFWQH